ncbi:hypothetical protein HG536_0E01220 [Torulaspora globosa]|uniref:EF-hand domain-containing protein n=1 Tax=Torulaspora globosa TaxID=48254 RepID=A0A7G3ZI75_9SACH|nr:uncharacterized protein HG536_0E01220 [Torulaspora globosa]QLL33211.1 hypothetical protein HG536_0E01220 [Torulaspora globosa]
MRESKRRMDEEKLRRQQKHELKAGRARVDPSIHTPPIGAASNFNGNGTNFQNNYGSYNSPRYDVRPTAPSQMNAYATAGPSSTGSTGSRPRPPSVTAQFPARITPPPQRIVSSPPNLSSPATSGSRSSVEAIEDSKDVRIATQLFANHDIKKKGRLTAEELQNLLQNDDNTHFCISAVDALINLFGASRFGTINQAEFISLYKRVKNWRKIYVDNDINGSFTISVSEFHNSLQELGYLVPFEISEKLFDQYAEFMNQSVNGKELKFDKFVEALVWLMRLTKTFRRYDLNQEGIATIHYKDFIDQTLYLGRFLPH